MKANSSDNDEAKEYPTPVAETKNDAIKVKRKSSSDNHKNEEYHIHSKVESSYSLGHDNYDEKPQETKPPTLSPSSASNSKFKQVVPSMNITSHKEDTAKYRPQSQQSRRKRRRRGGKEPDFVSVYDKSPTYLSNGKVMKIEEGMHKVYDPVQNEVKEDDSEEDSGSENDDGHGSEDDGYGDDENDDGDEEGGDFVDEDEEEEADDYELEEARLKEELLRDLGMKKPSTSELKKAQELPESYLKNLTTPKSKIAAILSILNSNHSSLTSNSSSDPTSSATKRHGLKAFHTTSVEWESVPKNGFKAKFFELKKGKSRTIGRAKRLYEVLLNGIEELLCPENRNLVRPLDSRKMPSGGKEAEFRERLEANTINLCLRGNRDMSTVAGSLLAGSFRRDPLRKKLEEFAKDLDENGDEENYIKSEDGEAESSDENASTATSNKFRPSTKPKHTKIPMSRRRLGKKRFASLRSTLHSLQNGEALPKREYTFRVPKERIQLAVDFLRIRMPIMNPHILRDVNIFGLVYKQLPLHSKAHGDSNESLFQEYRSACESTDAAEFADIGHIGEKTFRYIVKSLTSPTGVKGMGQYANNDDDEENYLGDENDEIEIVDGDLDPDCYIGDDHEHEVVEVVEDVLPIKSEYIEE